MASNTQQIHSPPMSAQSSVPSSVPAAPASNGDIPRPKRIACVVCRKRKLRCDGNKPSCGTCSRLNHDCAYDEIRRKSGPKRGYVKALEARLAQVETLLKNQDAAAAEQPRVEAFFAEANFAEANPVRDDGRTAANTAHERARSMNPDPFLNFGNTTMAMGGVPSSSIAMEDMTTGWDMMSLGVEEPLPQPEVQENLHTIFFEKVYPTLPMIHKARYMSSLNLAPNMRPPIALRYAMWTLAASISDEYFNLQTHFYQMARKYAEEQELRGHGEHLIAVSTSQTWIMIASYEFKLMYFPRAWLSTGRAVRLAQMMGLHRLDGTGLDVKQCLQPPKDWTEREERRRTFWMAFCVDRYASIGTGWPMTIEEKDIMTNLPTSEEGFENGRPARSLTLKEAMTPEGAKHLSPFGGVVLMACLFGRNLIHLHRPDGDDRDDDINGEFWRRHRHMDNILLSIALSLPSHFKLPMGINDPNIVFTNMNIHTSTICLHQAAIFKADKHRMPPHVSAESKVRCINAAAEIAAIMRMIAHMDLSGMNPFLSFCLYVAARVFVQYLKSRPKDEQVRASLQFLLMAMGHIKKKNPLTESFLVQLDVDLAGMLDSPMSEIYGGDALRDTMRATTEHISRSPFLHCPMDNQEIRQRMGQDVRPEIPLTHSSPSENSPSASSMDMADSSMTPSSSHTTNTSPHDTPVNQSLNLEPFSPGDSQLGDIFALGSSGFTPLPQDNPLTPPKSDITTAWMNSLTDDPELVGIYTELLSGSNQYGWK